MFWFSSCFPASLFSTSLHLIRQIKSEMLADVFESIKNLIYMVLLLPQERPYIFLIMWGNCFEFTRKPTSNYGYWIFPLARLCNYEMFLLLGLEKSLNENLGLFRTWRTQNLALPDPSAFSWTQPDPVLQELSVTPLQRHYLFMHLNP